MGGEVCGFQERRGENGRIGELEDERMAAHLLCNV
jgi:hypothetical protein